MNEEIEDADDERPSNLLRASQSSSISSMIDNSVNKPMPWVAMSIGVAMLSLGLSIGSILLCQLEISHAQERLQENTKQTRLLDNDWQITNAWLAEHHVMKDVHGNYYFEGEKHGQ